VQQPDKQRDHHPAQPLHEVDVQAETLHAAEGHEHHPVAAQQQQQDGDPDPGQKFRKERRPQLQPHRRLERTGRRPQAHIGREHAADPDDGAENMKGKSKCGHRLSFA